MKLNNEFVGPQNIDSLLIGLESELSQDGKGAVEANASMLATFSNQLKGLRSQKMAGLRVQEGASGIKDKIKAKIKIVGVDKLIKKIEGQLNVANGESKQDLNVDQRTDDRIRNIFREVSEGKTTLLDQSESLPQATTSVNGSVGGALRAEVQLNHQVYSQQKRNQRQKGDEVQTSLSQQQSSMSNQIQKMEKASFWGKMMGVITQAVVSTVSIASATLGPLASMALSSLANLGMAGITQSVVGGISKQAQRYGLMAQNAQINAQQLQQQQQQQNGHDQKQVNHSAEMIQQLESNL